MNIVVADNILNISSVNEIIDIGKREIDLEIVSVGLQGIEGAKGVDGLDGNNGLSAYEIAINNGFVGTEQEWLDSFNTPPAVEEIPELPISKITGLDTALNQKINISDVLDVLNSTDSTKPLSANQGRILKGFIDNINTVLNSDDTTLDELQEIVNFIKQNKIILDTLSIGNIAGLQEALNNIYNKSEIDLMIGDINSALDTINGEVI